MDSELILSLKVIDPAELGRRIQRLRLQRGLTQGQLGAGVASTAYVSRIESGQRRPVPEVLAGLAKNLDVSAGELLVGEATPLRTRAQLELDYAELELVTGSAAKALERLETLPSNVDTDQRHLADLLAALAGQALGKDPIPTLEKLVAQNPVKVTTWFRAQMALCRALRDSGELDSAAAAGEAALARAQELKLVGTDEGIELAATLAGIYEMRGEIPRALRLAHGTLAAADEASTPRAHAYVYWNASVCESEQGNMAAAIDYADRAITLLGAEGDARQRALLRANIGRFLLQVDPPDLAAAVAALDQATRELAATGASATEVAHVTVERARAHTMTGNSATAGALLQEVLDHQESLGAFLVADAFVLQGEILLPHDKNAAVAAYHQAVLKLSASGQDRAVARLWYTIAAKFEAIGDAPAALDAYRRAGVATGMLPSTHAAKALT